MKWALVAASWITLILVAAMVVILPPPGRRDGRATVVAVCCGWAALLSAVTGLIMTVIQVLS